jgi:anti-sigma factor RsiW
MEQAIDHNARLRRMTGPDPRRLRRYLLDTPIRETPECLDDDTIAALADGTLDAAARTAVLPHLATCARCRGAVASVARALADSGVAREVAAIEGAGRRRFYRIAVPLAAAAALLLIFAWPRQTDDGTPGHRGPPVTAAAPVPVSPVGAVAEASVLQWTALAGADRYRVTLFEAGGRAVYETELADTAAALPDSVRLVPGRSYVWMVEARIGFDRWSTSRLAEFSIVGGASP